MSYSDAFEVLKENRIIDEKLAERLKETANFRNFLVHRYAFVQKEKISGNSKTRYKRHRRICESCFEINQKIAPGGFEPPSQAPEASAIFRVLDR